MVTENYERMNQLIAAARIWCINFDKLDTGKQFEILKQLEPNIIPEDLEIYHEQKYVMVDIPEIQWGEYLKYYLNY